MLHLNNIIIRSIRECYIIFMPITLQSARSKQFSQSYYLKRLLQSNDFHLKQTFTVNSNMYICATTYLKRQFPSPLESMGVISRVSFGWILVEQSCVSNCETGMLGRITGSGYLTCSKWQMDLKTSKFKAPSFKRRRDS